MYNRVLRDTEVDNKEPDYAEYYILSSSYDKLAKLKKLHN